MKINICWGELPDDSAKKEALSVTGDSDESYLSRGLAEYWRDSVQ